MAWACGADVSSLDLSRGWIKNSSSDNLNSPVWRKRRAAGQFSSYLKTIYTSTALNRPLFCGQSQKNSFKMLTLANAGEQHLLACFLTMAEEKSLSLIKYSHSQSHSEIRSHEGHWKGRDWQSYKRNPSFFPLFYTIYKFLHTVLVKPKILNLL